MVRRKAFIVSHRVWRLAAGTVLSLGLLWLAARGVSWAELGVAIRFARWHLIAVAVVCVVLSTVLRAWCWQRLLGATKVPVTLVRAWKILLISQFLNICVPARAGDVARVYLPGEATAMQKTGAATSLVLEKFFDATTFLLLLGLVSLLVELPDALAGVGRGFAVAALLLALAVAALAWRGTWLVRFLERHAHGDGGWAARLARHGETVVEGLKILRRWHRVVVMQAGYLGVWLALAGGNYAVLRALEISAPVGAAFVVLVVLQVGTSVPSTPGKIGVFQYLAVLALAPFGLGREAALTYGVLLHVVGVRAPGRARRVLVVAGFGGGALRLAPSMWFDQKMREGKLGRIFDPADGPAWMVSHAAPAAALHLDADRFRVWVWPTFRRRATQGTRTTERPVSFKATTCQVPSG